MTNRTKVEDNPELVRDNNSKAIINTDSSAYIARVKERQANNQKRMESEQLKKLNADSKRHEQKINDIDSKLDKILELMMK